MSYALVEDIAASWEQYGAIARSVSAGPTGLVLHVAGPTDEGFRIIEIWESEDAWRQFAPERERALEAVDPPLQPRPVVRDVHALHVVFGSPRMLQRIVGAAAGSRP